MHIETQYVTDSLNVMADFWYLWTQNNTSYGATTYFIYYRTRTTPVFYIMNATTESNGNTYFTTPYYKCTLNLFNGNGEAISSQDFDFDTAINNCSEEQTTTYFPSTYQANNNIYKYVASNTYQENYLNLETYKTSISTPSPSPEPEEPSGETTDYTNWFILISAILMLLVMYRFIGSLFSRGKE